MSGHCFKCQKELHYTANAVIGRRDTCDSCGSDVHACKNCDFYDSKAYNECREPNADRIVEKERSNFCDYFKLRLGKAGAAAEDKSAQMKKLDDLFK